MIPKTIPSLVRYCYYLTEDSGGWPTVRSFLKKERHLGTIDYEVRGDVEISLSSPCYLIVPKQNSTSAVVGISYVLQKRGFGILL